MWLILNIGFDISTKVNIGTSIYSIHPKLKFNKAYLNIENTVVKSYYITGMCKDCVNSIRYHSTTYNMYVVVSCIRKTYLCVKQVYVLK